MDKEEAREQHDFDEAQTWLNNSMPSMLWDFYCRACKAGFSQFEAFELTREYMLSLFSR